MERCPIKSWQPGRSSQHELTPDCQKDWLAIIAALFEHRSLQPASIDILRVFPR